MKQTFVHRLQKLEGVDEAGRQIAQVVRLDVDGQWETPLEDLDAERPIIALPRKAASAEEWAAAVRRRWPQSGGGRHAG